MISIPCHAILCMVYIACCSYYYLRSCSYFYKKEKPIIVLKSTSKINNHLGLLRTNE